MDIVDMQLHDPGPWLPWSGATVETRRAVLTEVLYQMLDAVGVSAVALHPVEDLDWARMTAEADPGRFVTVPMVIGRAPERLRAVVVDPYKPTLEQELADAAASPCIGGIRVVVNPQYFPEEFARYKTGGYDRVFAACQTLGLPLLLMVAGHADTVSRVAEKFPELQIIIDHLGIAQPPMEMPTDPPWERVSTVTRLARYPNIAIKMCHPAALSAMPYPYEDVWPYVHEFLDAYGADRLAWGSDIGRFRGRAGWNSLRKPRPFRGEHTYFESLGFFRDTTEISPAEKEAILGRTARHILRWPSADDSGGAR